ncbi:MAG: 50S ribosomal protein L30 [Rikenellaceae bacterium]|nr:50S ribosomal protein L30 [Rikenellaceae bacterium]
MATLKITQIKSRIGSTAQQCKNLDALGLRKINQTVTHSDSAIIKGMVTRVKHLVKVEVVEEAPAKKPAAKKVTKTNKEE